MRIPDRNSLSDLIFNSVVYAFLAIILILVLYPLIYVVSASFSDPEAIISGEVWLLPRGMNVLSYERVINNNSIWIGYKNTVIYTFFGTLINVVMTVMAAYPLSRRDFKGRNIIMLAIVFTMFFHGGLIPTYLVVYRLNMINTIWAMLIPNALSAFNIIITRTFFQTNIPGELNESAYMDGCNNIRLLAYIVLPLSKPILAVITLFYGVVHWNSFFQALIYLSDYKLYPLQIVLRDILIQNQMQAMMDFDAENLSKQLLISEGLKYAVIIVSVLPMLILYPFMQKYFVKGVMYGAIKG